MANTLNFGNGKWGVQDGLALAYNDENNNFKPLPFDFTRDSIGTYVDRDGLIKTASNNVPRVDFTDSTDGALLLEPARTNLMPYSTLAFNGGSIPTGYTIGFGTGTYSYEELTYKGQGAVKQTQSTTGRSYIDAGVFTLSAGVTYTFRMEIDLANTSASSSTIIMGFNGFETNITKTIADVDSNGILEFDFAFNTDATGNIRIGLGSFGDASGGQYITWGMPQVEQGSYATSYIPTSGSTVERVAETCSQTPTTGIIGQTEGVLYAEISANETSNAVSQRTISLSDATNANRMYISFDDEYNKLNILIILGDIPVINSDVDISNQNVFNKIAIKYKSGDTSVYVNGSLVQSSADTFSVGNLNILKFNNRGNGSYFYGNCKDLKLYNTALTNAELAKLTTT